MFQFFCCFFILIFVDGYGKEIEQSVNPVELELQRLASLPKVLKAVSNIASREDLRFLQEANDHQEIEVLFSQKHKNLDVLERSLYDVSDPSSANYGKHWTKTEINTLICDFDAINQVRSTLESVGFEITQEMNNGEFMRVKGKIHQFETLFDARFNEYIYENKGLAQDSVMKEEVIIRADKYHLPQILADLVEEVFNVVNAPIPVFHANHLRKVGSVTTEGSGVVIPSLINSYYSVTNNTGSPLTDQAFYGNLNQTMSPSDLTNFQQRYNLPIQALAKSIGGYVSDSICQVDVETCAEANLDVQYLMSTANTIPTTYYYWNGSSDPWLDWIISVNDMDNPPDVISISYSSYELFFTLSYANSFNIQAQQLGLRGVTILAASGDDGVAGYAVRTRPQFCFYYPQFPASSPYVVAVGGTQGPESGSTEIACSSQTGSAITTGGGFSDYFVAPSYQTSKISSYFKSVSQQPEPGYNLTGRGYPDVSLLAHNYQVVIGGNIYSLDGTSASCPVFAGFLALINSARKKNNQSTVGFVQPLLYSTYTNWAIDITSGQNNCCATNSKGTVCCTEGFAASIGWDPVTGLGSANFAKLYASAMGQPIPTSSAVYSLSIPFYSFGVSMILYLFLGFN